MKRIPPALLLFAALLSASCAAFASDEETPILVQEILVSVQNHRRVLNDMDHLTASLRRSSAMQDISEFPSMKEFVQDSLNPSHMQLQALFSRYREEYGDRNLQKLAKEYRFTDLLPE